MSSEILTLLCAGHPGEKRGKYHHRLLKNSGTKPKRKCSPDSREFLTNMKHRFPIVSGLSLLLASTMQACEDTPPEPSHGASGSGASGAGASGAGALGGASGGSVGGGTGLGGAGQGGSAGASGTSGKGAGECGSRPDEIPAGWEEFSGYSCDCRVFFPGENVALPAVEWGGCPAEAPQNAQCRATIEPPGVSTGTAWARLSLNQEGKQALFIVRGRPVSDSKGVSQLIASELDGPVRTALIWVSTADGCSIGAENFSDGMYALNVDGDGPGDPPPAKKGHSFGVVAGSMNEAKPRLAFRYKIDSTNPISSNWNAFGLGLLRATAKGISLVPWDGSEPIDIYKPPDDPQSLLGFFRYSSGTDIILKVNGGGHTGFYSWDPKNKLRPLLRSPTDLTRGYGNLGTDGKDMVWTLGEGTRAL